MICYAIRLFQYTNNRPDELSNRKSLRLTEHSEGPPGSYSFRSSRTRSRTYHHMSVWATSAHSLLHLLMLRISTTDTAGLLNRGVITMTDFDEQRNMHEQCKSQSVLFRSHWPSRWPYELWPRSHECKKQQELTRSGMLHFQSKPSCEKVGATRRRSWMLLLRNPTRTIHSKQAWWWSLWHGLNPRSWYLPVNGISSVAFEPTPLCC